MLRPRAQTYVLTACFTAAVWSVTQRGTEASDASAAADAPRFPSPSLLKRRQAHATDRKHCWGVGGFA